MHGISFIFRNNLNGSWDFYHVPMWLPGSSMAIGTMAKTKNLNFFKVAFKIISKTATSMKPLKC
jgi:hypothetical protein